MKTISFVQAFWLSLIDARQKLRESESMASPVPSSLDVLREFRQRGFPDAIGSDVLFIADHVGVRLADSDPPADPPTIRTHAVTPEWIAETK